MVSDEILAEQAIKQGLLTEDQLAECRKLQKKIPGKSLLEMLSLKGYLTPEQIAALNIQDMDDSEEFDEELFLSSDATGSSDPEQKKISDPDNLAPASVEPPPGVPVSDLLPSIEERSLKQDAASQTAEGSTDAYAQEREDDEFKIKADFDPDAQPLPVAKPQPNLPLDFADALQEEPVTASPPDITKTTGSSPTNLAKSDEDASLVSEPDTRPKRLTSPSKRLDTAKFSKTMSTPFGKAAILLRMATQEQVNDALLTQVTEFKDKKVGEIMVEKGYMTPQQVEKVLARQETRTMGCPTCKKKYQIVLFQEGRSYKCKTCQVDLIDVQMLEEDKKKKRQSMPEQLQVMGLTQAIPVMARKKKDRFDTSDIDFAPDDEKSISEAPPAQVVSTERMLQEVGLEVPTQYIPDVTRRPQVHKKTNYVRWGLGAITLIVIFLIVFYATSKPGKPTNSLPNNNQQPQIPNPVSEEEERIKKMNETYQALIQRKVDKQDERALTRLQHDWQAFLQKYPNTPYRIQALEEISAVEALIKNIVLNRALDKVETQVQQSLNIGNFAQAMTTIENFAMKTADSNLTPKIGQMMDHVKDKAKINIQRIFSEVSRLQKLKKFSEAIKRLQQDKKKQITSHQKMIDEKIAELQSDIRQHAWMKIANEVLVAIYPLLFERNYDKALARLSQFRATQIQFNKEFEMWSADIKRMQLYWQGLQTGLNKAKGQKMVLQQEDGKKITAKIWNFRPRQELLFYIIKNKYANIKLGQLATATLRKLLEETVPVNTIEKRIQFAIFTIPWKISQTMRQDVPEIDKFPLRKQMFVLYLVAATRYAINVKEMGLVYRLVRDLRTYYNESLAFDSYKNELGDALWGVAQEYQKRHKRSSAKKTLLLIYTYLKDTPAGYKAKKALGK